MSTTTSRRSLLFGRIGSNDRRPRGVLVVALAMVALLAFATLVLPLFVHLDPDSADLGNRFAPVGTEGHLLGTDQLGRDSLARVVYGFRWSVGVAATATAILVVIGTVIGVLAGSTSGIARVLVIRAIDISLSLPYLVIAVVILTVWGRGFLPLCATLGIVSWPILARVVYAETRSLMSRDYVVAARLGGVRPVRSVVTHVLPGLQTVILVMAAFLFADMIVAESGLSFLGLGATVGAPSLGSMLSDGRTYIVSSPALSIVPGVAIALAVITANLLGNGLSEQTDTTGARR